MEFIYIFMWCDVKNINTFQRSTTVNGNRKVQIVAKPDIMGQGKT
jgi:hypothetical protein